MSKTSSYEFQAETKQVLDIVVNSLYKDKEIFVRELISNASDALEKLRRTQLTEKEVFDDNLELEISLSTDDSSKQLIIHWVRQLQYSLLYSTCVCDEYQHNASAVKRH